MRGGLESARKSSIEINDLTGNPTSVLEEVILMPASTSSTDAAQAGPATWVLRAERARRIAAMLSVKDAVAIEAYAKECEAMARQAIERPSIGRTPALSLAA